MDSLEIDGIKTHYTLEQLQDIEIQMRMLRQVRTNDFTEEELEIWKSISFGPKPTPPEEYDTSPECVTWRDILECNGPAHRCPILTGEITQQEVNEWGVEYEKLKKIDIEEVKKKYNVKLESDEEKPYKDDGCNPPAASQRRKPIQWPSWSEIFPWVESVPYGEMFDCVSFFSNRETYDK
jgi:hypothetical protein